MWVYGLDWAGPGYRQVADACECGNELSGSVKCGEFLDQLQTSQLLKNYSAPWSKQMNISAFVGVLIKYYDKCMLTGMQLILEIIRTIVMPKKFKDF